MAPQPDCNNELPLIDEVLRDPSASSWLRSSLSAALARDPVDAANDAEVLARVLDARCRRLLENGGNTDGLSPFSQELKR